MIVFVLEIQGGLGREGRGSYLRTRLMSCLLLLPRNFRVNEIYHFFLSKLPIHFPTVLKLILFIFIIFMANQNNLNHIR